MWARSVWWGAECFHLIGLPALARGARGDVHAEALPQPPRYPRFGKFVIDPTSEDGRSIHGVWVYGKGFKGLQACSLCEMVESLTELDIFVRYPPRTLAAIIHKS